MFSEQKHFHLNANIVFNSLYLSCLEVLNQITFDWTEQKKTALRKFLIVSIDNSIFPLFEKFIFVHCRTIFKRDSFSCTNILFQTEINYNF